MSHGGLQPIERLPQLFEKLRVHIASGLKNITIHEISKSWTEKTSIVEDPPVASIEVGPKVLDADQ